MESFDFIFWCGVKINLSIMYKIFWIIIYAIRNYYNGRYINKRDGNSWRKGIVWYHFSSNKCDNILCLKRNLNIHIQIVFHKMKLYTMYFSTLRKKGILFCIFKKSNIFKLSFAFNTEKSNIKIKNKNDFKWLFL